ncbi:MAG: bacillithiol biosynthesis cysteine-adding enzyme BshC [Bryobacteraceae bacterium]
MECTCIRHTELPHTSKLFADYAYHFDRVRSFYRHAPHDLEEFRRAAAEINLPDDRRQALVAALRTQNGDSESLRLLAQPGTVAVVTGQQVGLFSGPAYTIYKALTAVRLARDLTASGQPAVPVFWLATEDHDLAEVNHCWAFNPAHQPLKLVAGDAVANGGPVGEVAPAGYPIDELRHHLREFPFGEEVVAMVEDAYRPGATLGAAFGALLKRLLPAYGLLHIDPMLPAVRELAAPMLRSVLADAPDLSARLIARSKELVDAGYHAQVHLENHTSLVFLLEDGRRIGLKRNGREYSAGGRRLSTEELMDRAAHLSPNALLRPVVQDSILPTVAYIGGAAELAYLAQSQVIYDAKLGRMPVALPRAGFTLLDQRSEKLMKRYGIALTDLFGGEEALRERIAAQLVPPSLARVLEDAKSSTSAAGERLSEALSGFDPTLAAALASSRGKINYQFGKIERKVRREALLRDTHAGRDSSYIAGLIYPEKHLQERFYSIVPFLARHGLDLVDRLYENIQLDCPDHRLLTV